MLNNKKSKESDFKNQGRNVLNNKKSKESDFKNQGKNVLITKSQRRVILKIREEMC